ncbi:MAG: 16S rRNA (cytosine(967)-C(5))-methyltransferase RsmB [bacterium]
MKPAASAREVAIETLLAWERSRETADALLAERLDASRLAPRDRDLAAELVRGVFRWRGRLDWQLASLVDRPVESLDPPVLACLRLGLYQLDRLDRIPRHAAVDTSVQLAKRYARRGASGLVNAVLRRAPEALLALVEPDASEDPVGHLAARTSHPRWLLERWVARLGFRRTLQLAAANNTKPSLTLRVTSDRVDAVDLLADLAARGVAAEPGRFLPDTVRLLDGWTPAISEWLADGTVVVQDEAAGLVAYVARPAGGLRVLDVCAAPGGKAVRFADLCGDAEIVAADRSARRLASLRQTLARTGVPGIRLLVADGLQPATRGGFGRVLVDAPCTNTGVLGRRPDARWRRGPEDVIRLATLQGELLDAGREQVGPGGLLVYSTCSLEPEENEHVVRDYLARHPGDTIVSAAEVLPEEIVENGCLRVEPHEHGTDGAFAAAIRPGARGLSVIAR